MTDSHAGHDHGISHAPEKALRWALVLTGGLMLVEAIGGWLTNSLALISDAAHMLTDTAALAIALAAIHIGKRPADSKRTYGYARFEILAAAVNAVVLFLVAIYIFWEAIDRFRNPSDIQSIPVMIVAALGLMVNLISMRLLHAGSDHNLNVKGAYLEVWSDMLGSVGVLAGSVIIYFTGWTFIDPIIAVAIALWVLPRTWILLKESFNILLEGVPAGVDTAEIERAIRNCPGVSGIHDLHVWAVSSGKLLLTAHVERSEETPQSDDQLLHQMQEILAAQFKISHSTIQLERVNCVGPNCSLTEKHNIH